jgi:hypothetical protein
MNTLQLFTTLLIVQLFWAFSVTMLVPNMPNNQSNQVLMFNNDTGLIKLNVLQSSLETGIGDQANIPVLEVGALVFYSSATILSLMINFFTAVPQMVTLLITVFFMFIPLPLAQQNITLAWIWGIVSILYIISLFAFIAGTRSNLGGGIL